MIKKGYTLIEVLVALCLLGLIAVTILPIISFSYTNLNRHNIKLEMIYLGEMAMEKIKAFKLDSNVDVFICDMPVYEIIELFQLNESIELTIPKTKDNEKYFYKIQKEQKNDVLWLVSVYVYDNKKGSNIGHVKYKAYMPSK